MKKILYILPIIALSACSSNPNTKECPPEKNYIISNPEAMEKYKEEFKNGDIKSLYYYKENRESCKMSSCISFDYKKHEFAEFYFNDALRKGIYTSYWSDNKKDEKCKETPQLIPGPKGCFYLVKNKNNEIKSKYGIYMNHENKVNLKKFYNIKNNVTLYETSSTIYMTGAIGGPGYGICNIKDENVNNPKYRFYTNSFPYDPNENIN